MIAPAKQKNSNRLKNGGLTGTGFLRTGIFVQNPGRHTIKAWILQSENGIHLIPETKPSSYEKAIHVHQLHIDAVPYFLQRKKQHTCYQS